MVNSKTTAKAPKAKRMLLVVIGTFVIGACFSSLLGFIVDSTNTTEFCISCHSMQLDYDQLKNTKHWKNRSGVHAGCPDCHVPREFWPKLKVKILASKDVWHEIAGTIATPEKYASRRQELAARVWKQMQETDSRECRNCHSFAHMDPNEQKLSANREHTSTGDKGKTCIDCHQGIAHGLPDESGSH